MTQPSRIPSPEALARIARGFDHLAAVIAATLGPTQGAVLSQTGRGAPEVLIDSGTIARRVVQLPRRGEDAGAMLLRHLVFNQRERYGDGAATAAVLARAMVQEARQRIAAGADAMLLRHGIERAVGVACQALCEQATSVSGQGMLTRLAIGVTGDQALGAMLGEMFDLLGADAALQVDEFAAPYLDREYLEGGRWRGRPAARTMLPQDGRNLVLDSPLLVVADQKIANVEHIQAALEQVAAMPDKPPLLVLAGEIGGEALDMIVLNHNRGTLKLAAAVMTGGAGKAHDDLADAALLAGAELMGDLRGRPLHTIEPSFFGQVRRAVIGREWITLIGGAGDKAAIRSRIAELRGYASRLNRNDPEWKQIRQRIARLSSGVGILKVGAHTQREREMTKELADKAVQVLEWSLAEGVVPGGGAAYLAVIPAVCALQQQEANSDIAQGIAIVTKALAAPFSQIVKNHGLIHPPLALAEVQRRGPGYGFDTLRADYVDMRACGVLDSLRVVQGALEGAASAAAMVLTTDVMVFSPRRQGKAHVRP